MELDEQLNNIVKQPLPRHLTTSWIKVIRAVRNAKNKRGYKKRILVKIFKDIDKVLKGL